MRSHILLVVVLLTGCRNGDRLQRVTKCGQPCYTLSGKADVGQCQSGSWVCTDDQDESTATCERQVGPAQEVCDGLDNDCDGTVDHLRQSCSNECGQGYETCTTGVWEGCSAPLPKPEICNGKDDDCDGRYDEPEDLPLEYCYTGPQGSVQFGECRPGIQRCELGVKVCFGEVTPKPEACDGKDNDCDGAIDEGTGNNDPVDIVFVIDNSGSMGNTIAAVKAAANSFANTYGTRADLRWGLAVAPDPDPYYDQQVRLYSDMNTAAVFAAAMQRMGANGGGSEPTIDALVFLADPANPLHVTWRAGSRHVVIMFTDEEPQSYTTPSNTVMTAFNAIQTAGIRVYLFTDSYQSVNWLPALPTGWGQLKPLTSIASVMEAELNTVIQEAACH